MIHDLFLRFPGGLSKVFTMSYDDGTVHDKRLVEIMDKYNVKGTFNLNSGKLCKEFNNRLVENEVVELFKNSNHEVAVHTTTHPSLATIPQPSMVYQIINDRNNLEKMFGTIIRGMAYPNGTWAVNDDVVEATKTAGILYSRGTRATHTFNLPTDDFLRFEPTCHHNDEKVFSLLDEFISNKIRRFSEMFYLWGHSYEFNNDNNWERIEQILEKISNRDDVWYATGKEIFEYVNAYKNLVYSVELNTIINPTSTDIYLTYDYGEPIVIKAGHTITL